jgi:hypothetical protein
VSAAQAVYQARHDASVRAAQALTELEERIAAGGAVAGADLAARRADVEIAAGSLTAAERELREVQRIEDEERVGIEADAFLVWHDEQRQALVHDLEDARAALDHFAANVAEFNSQLRARKDALAIRLVPGVVDPDPIFGPHVRGQRAEEVTGYELVAGIAALAMRTVARPTDFIPFAVQLEGLASSARPIDG